MIKTILIAVLKIVGGLVGIIILIVGFMIYRSYGPSGYRTGLFGVGYFDKSSHESWFYSKRKLKGAHKGSFEVFDKNKSYAKDKKRVYYKGIPIPESDPSSFSVKQLFSNPPALNEYALCRDKNNIYYKVNLVSRDADNFVQYSDPNIFMDSKNVFELKSVPKPKYSGENHFVIVEGANPKTFESVPGFKFLYRDDQHVFYRNKMVASAKIDNLRKIESFWTDGQSVFFNEHKLKDADISSFQVLDYPYARDAGNLYYEHLLMEGASPEGLIEIKNSNGYATAGTLVFFEGKPLKDVDLESLEKIYYHYWKDKQRVYFENELLQDADPNTFELLKNTRGRVTDFGRDANSVFYKSRKLEGVNPSTFVKSGKDRWRNDRWTDGNLRFSHLGEQL